MIPDPSPQPAPPQPRRGEPRPSAFARLRLAVAAAAFVGWTGYLGYAALTKGPAAVVSRPQFRAATSIVVADLVDDARGGPSRQVRVTELLRGDEPAVGEGVEVGGLGAAAGYGGAGAYLLPLVKVDGRYEVAEMPRSPGLEPRRFVYAWDANTRADVAWLLK